MGLEPTTLYTPDMHHLSQDAERKTRTDVYILVSDRLVEDWEDKLQSECLIPVLWTVSFPF